MTVAPDAAKAIAQIIEGCSTDSRISGNEIVNTDTHADGVDMGLVMFYQTTARLSPVRKAAIERRASQLCSGRRWEQCQPLSFAPWRSGRLRGKSRMGLQQELPTSCAVQCASNGQATIPSDSQSLGLPTGKLVDVVSFLCDLSVEFGVTWEIRLERSGEIVGQVAHGQCDEQLLKVAGNIAPLADLLDLRPTPIPPLGGSTRLADTLFDELGGDLSSIHVRLANEIGGADLLAGCDEFDSELDAEDGDEVDLDEDQLGGASGDDDGPIILRFPS